MADRIPPHAVFPHLEETLLRALLLALATTLPAATVTLPAPAAHAVATGEFEREAVSVTNKQRARRGLRVLRADACLARFADRHAARMADHQRLFHQDLTRILRGCDLSRVGENVAYGYRDGQAVVTDGWMDSPGHRANILASRYRLVAVGAARSNNGHWYTSQVFGTR